ncbi:MAG: riboflavin synthase [Candidatus Pacebacteria bacterium]|nr:riboflavin synthase [Candidatus Paceibacterota bacterium]MDD5356867.1 riboflavin synthase [Candidatus Paceibacterota bacterium]
MFTGIITHLGKFERNEKEKFFFSASASFLDMLHSSDSVAVNGTCLTVVKKTKGEFLVNLMPETVKRTMLGTLLPKTVVNLELPATPRSFLAGHIVQGHIDGIGTLSKMEKKGSSRVLEIVVERKLMRYIVDQGSVAVNGISLTVIEAKQKSFTFGIIPYTWEHTMLKGIKLGDKVNIEVDILAKYAEKISKY